MRESQQNQAVSSCEGVVRPTLEWRNSQSTPMARRVPFYTQLGTPIARGIPVNPIPSQTVDGELDGESLAASRVGIDRLVDAGAMTAPSGGAPYADFCFETRSLHQPQYAVDRDPLKTAREDP